MNEDKTMVSGGPAVGKLMIFFPDVLERGSVVLEIGNIGSVAVHVVFDSREPIPSKLLLCASGERWCEIKDDTGAQIVVHGEYIDVYQINDSGILVHAYGDWRGWMDTFVND